MKKLMIAAAVVCAAVAAQAEATWVIRNAGAYNGYQLYSLAVCENISKASEFEQDALDGFMAMYMTESTAWEITGAKSWSEHYKAMSEMGSLSTIVDGVAAGTTPYIDQLRTVSFLLCKDGITAGGEYVLTEALYDESLFTQEVNEFDFTDMEPLQSGTFMVDDAIPVPPGEDVNVPSGYESATDFAEALNNGTADKSDYLKAPGDVTTTDTYLSYFSAVPSGAATVRFVLNTDGTNAVKAATEVAATNALAVVLSSSSMLTIADPLVGFYYSLKQGGAVTNLHFNAEGDRNKLGGRDEISFDLSKPEGAGFYQPLVTPTEYGD